MCIAQEVAPLGLQQSDMNYEHTLFGATRPFGYAWGWKTNAFSPKIPIPNTSWVINWPKAVV